MADQPGARLPRPGPRPCRSNIPIPLFMSVQRRLWNNYGTITPSAYLTCDMELNATRRRRPALRSPLTSDPSRVPLRSGNFWVSRRHYRGDGPLVPLAVNERRGSAVADGGEDGGSWLSARALFMWLVNWPAADCSGEIAVSLEYTSSSHTARRAPRRAPFHFISIPLRGSCGPALIPLFSSCVSD